MCAKQKVPKEKKQKTQSTSEADGNQFFLIIQSVTNKNVYLMIAQEDKSKITKIIFLKSAS